jgi:hypothetical protein
MIMEPNIIHEALTRIEQAKDPVDALRSEVLQHGGFWDDDVMPTEAKLFTINLHGIHAAGIGVTAALQSWCDQARTTVEEAAIPGNQTS